MINRDALLQWLDLHPQSYFWLVGGLITIALGLAVVPVLRDHREETRRHDWVWGWMILAILAAGRWPTFLVTREFNPDESALVAGAHTLLHDPVFWRSVEAGTSGPLSFFALWPAGWLFGWQTYVTARVTALVLLALTLILAHQCMALIVGRRIARAAGLAAVCFEALTNSPDFLHYSSELLPVALLTAAGYATIRRWVHQGGLGWNALGGLLLGAVPLAKLQAVPLGACLGLCWLWAELRTTGPDAFRRRFYLMAGALLPAALFACQLTVAGEWRNFIPSYFLFNLNYIATGSSSFRQLMLTILANSLAQDSLLHLWLAGSALWLVCLLRLRRTVDRATRGFLLAGLAACLVAFGSIVCPGRPFLHYWQFLVVPCSLLLGAMTGCLLPGPPAPWRKFDRWLVSACAVCVVGVLLQQRARTPNTFIGAFAFFQQKPRTELAARVAAHARPGDTLSIWGWSNFVYVETGLRQAGRDPNFERAVASGPYQEYFRQRFLVDLMHVMPPLFLDSVGPYTLFYQTPVFAHDRNYPELAAVIRAHYVQVDEISGARIYQRRDLVGR